MTALIVGYYIGLLVFALNGIQLIALRQEQREFRAKQDRIHKMLMRGQLRRIK